MPRLLIRILTGKNTRLLPLLLLLLPSVAGFAAIPPDRIDQLLDHLDLGGSPHLQQAAASQAAGETEAAAAAILRHFSSRSAMPDVLTPLDPPQGDFIDRARDAGQRRFHLQGVTGVQPSLPAGGLDWNHRGPRNDKEWAWMLNRHLFLADLYHAFRETGDIRHIEVLEALWADWLSANPYPGRISFSASWRPLEVSRRLMHVWIGLFFRLDEKLSPATRIAILCSLWEHGDKLYRFPSFWGGNHLITEKTALTLLASAFPEFRDAEKWRQKAVHGTIDQFRRQTYPDGAYMELTNHYQRVTLLNAQSFLEILKASGDPETAAEFQPLVESMWNYFIHLMRPDGTGPKNNASDLEWNRAIAIESARGFQRHDWEYILSYGEDGIPPSANRIWFPWSGKLIWRNNWHRDADWTFFHLGPRGTAHDHDDHLHLSIDVGGRPFLTDSGRYTYQPGRWRDFFKGPAAHNVLLLDGRGPRPRPRASRHPLPDPVSDRKPTAVSGIATFLSNTARGHGPAHHRRHVAYHPSGFWIVVDMLQTVGPREVAIHWHFHPDVEMEQIKSGLSLIASSAPTGVTAFRGQEWPFIAGHYSPQYNERIPRWQQIWTQNAIGNGWWVWLVRSPWIPDPVQRIAVNGDIHNLRVEVELPDERIQYSFSR